MIRTAWISDGGTYRWTLTRKWDDRPMLLVLMFNPSTADAEVDDPTISLLCWIASFNGYGGIVVVNLIPLRSSDPAEAVRLVELARSGSDAHQEALGRNLAVICCEARKAGAVLFGYGALAERCVDWAETVQTEINAVRRSRERLPVYCLGRTAAGYPKHPLARGKHKVPKNAPLQAWD
ncbi:MAG: DUF1643 domain-containing protein [Sinobacteraceae bacterium]|nr:DUF1643 domain-containing protein [Nevskiaceae bacterium]